MGLRFCSLASGSTGNSYVVRTDSTVLLVDSGISGKRILLGLEALGLTPEDINGILITHEHSDHITSIKMMARKAENALIYCSEGTYSGISERVPRDQVNLIEGSDSFDIGDIRIDAFDLSHDAAEPISYTMTAGGRSLSIITDTGVVTDDIYEHVKGANALVLEANHEVNVLRAGPYPYELQQRILSDHGHLSNDSAGKLVARMLSDREGSLEEDPPYVMLAHVSRNNNTPEMAYLTVRNTLFDEGYCIDRDVLVGVASHDEMSPEIEV